jgi:cytochrome P450
MLTALEDSVLNNERYSIKAGDYVYIPHSLNYTDEAYFKGATAFDPDRFLRQTVEGRRETKLESYISLGAGLRNVKGITTQKQVP